MKNRICIVGPAWVGDMVMTQCLFKLIMREDDTAIDVIAPDWTLPLLARMPEVRNAHALPIKHGSLDFTTRYRLAQKLRSYAYTQAIVLPNSWKSALIPWLAKIPKRTGYLGECRFGLLNDIRILDKKQFPRMIDRFAALATSHSQAPTTPIPIPCLTVPTPRVEKTLKKFSIPPIHTQPVLALCPGAEFGASKRWPESYYAQVALQKYKEGWSVWILGSKNDAPIAANIQSKTGDVGVLNLTGKTDLGEVIDLLSLVTVVVSNDSGLMHIAAALKKPLIALYGSTDPTFTPPLGDTAEVLQLGLPCSPCFKRECPLEHHRCMRELMPNTVLATIDKIAIQASCAY